MPRPSLSLAVVGADHPNKTGPLRRFEIAMCKPGEPVNLVLEPNNPADPQAVAVFSARGIQIGYVRAERAALVGGAIRRGLVSAIFQSAEKWGAIIRVHFDGTDAILPTPDTERRVQQAGAAKQDWWPDEVWPDD